MYRFFKGIFLLSDNASKTERHKEATVRCLPGELIFSQKKNKKKKKIRVFTSGELLFHTGSVYSADEEEHVSSLPKKLKHSRLREGLL